MPSPFPGMNPYLEQEDVWHDFHERFIPLAATLLGAQLRPRYIVKIDEHIYVHEMVEDSRRWLGEPTSPSDVASRNPGRSQQRDRRWDFSKRPLRSGFPRWTEND